MQQKTFDLALALIKKWNTTNAKATNNMLRFSSQAAKHCIPEIKNKFEEDCGDLPSKNILMTRLCAGKYAASQFLSR